MFWKICQLLSLKKLMALKNFGKLKSLVGYNIGGTMSGSKSFFLGGICQDIGLYGLDIGLDFSTRL